MIRYSFEFSNPQIAAGQNNFTPIFRMQNITRVFLTYMKCWFFFADSNVNAESRIIDGCVTFRLPSAPMGDVADQVIFGGTVSANAGNPFCTSNQDFRGRHEVPMGESFYALDCTYSFPVNYVIPIPSSVICKVYMALEETGGESSRLPVIDPEDVLRETVLG